MFLVALDLVIKIFESRDPAVACPEEPVLQIGFCPLDIC